MTEGKEIVLTIKGVELGVAENSVFIPETFATTKEAKAMFKAISNVKNKINLTNQGKIYYKNGLPYLRFRRQK